MAKVFPGNAHPRSGGRSINPTGSQHFRRSSIRMPHLPMATFVLRPPICAYVNSSGINCFRCLSFSAKQIPIHCRRLGASTAVSPSPSPQKDLPPLQNICMQVLAKFPSTPSFRLRWIFDFYIWFVMLWSTFVLLPLNEASRVEAISPTDTNRRIFQFFKGVKEKENRMYSF